MKTQNRYFPVHDEQSVYLKKIEGQIRGINKMVEEGQYCVDIVNQINAATSALRRVAENILARHMQTCVADALKGKSEIERQKKINEVLAIIRRMQK